MTNSSQAEYGSVDTRGAGPAGNGPNYAMQVAAATNLTLVNYAIGGATSGCGPGCSKVQCTSQRPQALCSLGQCAIMLCLLHACQACAAGCLAMTR